MYDVNLRQHEYSWLHEVGDKNSSTVSCILQQGKLNDYWLSHCSYNCDELMVYTWSNAIVTNTPVQWHFPGKPDTPLTYLFQLFLTCTSSLDEPQLSHRWTLSYQSLLYVPSPSRDIKWTCFNHPYIQRIKTIPSCLIFSSNTNNSLKLAFFCHTNERISSQVTQYKNIRINVFVAEHFIADKR